MSIGEALGWTGAVMLFPAIILLVGGGIYLEDSSYNEHAKRMTAISVMCAGGALGVTVIILWILGIWTNVK